MGLPEFTTFKMFQLILLINILTNFFTFAVTDNDFQSLKGVQDLSEPTNSGESKEFMGIPGFSKAINQYLQSMALIPSEDLYRSNVDFDGEQSNNSLIKTLIGGLNKNQLVSHVSDYVGGEIHITNNEVMLNGGIKKEQTIDLVFPSKRIVHTVIKKDKTENTSPRFFDLSSKIGSNMNSDESKTEPINRDLGSDLSQINNYRKTRSLLHNYEKAQDRKKRGLFGGTLQELGQIGEKALQIPIPYMQTLLGATGMGGGGGGGNGGAAPAAAGK